MTDEENPEMVTPTEADQSPPLNTSFTRTVAPDLEWGLATLELGSSSQDDNGDGQNDASRNRDPSRMTRCCLFFGQKLQRTLNIIAYPFMIIFTLISLLLIVTFCIIPTIFCMSLGICAYYCFTEDPIPLHLLLRYMFSPDSDTESAFAAGNVSSSYPLAHNRTLIQSKLIVRKLIKIMILSKENEVDHTDKVYPRRYPSPIWIRTGSKSMHFSEPLKMNEESDSGDDDANKKKLVKSPRRRSGENTDNNPDDDRNIVSNVPHHQRSVQREISIRNIREILPDILPTERTQAATHIENMDVGFSSPSPDPEAEDLHGEAGEEISTSGVAPGGQEGDSDANENVQHEGEIRIDANCRVTDDHSPDKTANAEQDAHCLSSSSQKLEVDYFGIENDARDRHTACDICLLEYEVGDEVAWSPNMACSHTYHKDCILDWLVRKPTCPNCRHDYTKGKKDSKSK